jgi:hypothetical protein
MPIPSHSAALLPTNTNINPSDPTSNEYFSDGDSSLEVVRSSRTGKLTVAQTYGNSPRAIGDAFEAHHDQQGYTFGLLTVVAIRRPNGDVEGDLPTRKLSLRVYK